MIRVFACVVLAVASLSILHGDDTERESTPLANLHQARIDLLSEDLAAIGKLHRDGQATETSVDEAKIRLYLAEAEAANDVNTVHEKQAEVIRILESLVDRTKDMVDRGIAPPKTLRDTRLRLIETQIQFHSGG